MKKNSQIPKEKLKVNKGFQPIDSKKLETIVGGPETSRGTKTEIP